MRIAELAPLIEAVPPFRYGGTERVVDWLCRELTARGHEVTLFASGDSRAPGRVLPTVPRALRGMTEGLYDPIAWELCEIEQLRDRIDEFDVVHSHLDYLPFHALEGLRTPLVTTLHGRLDVGGLAEIYLRHPDRPLVSISWAQRRQIPDAPWIATIHHGLPLSDYEPGPGDGGYLLFLGRISPEKRPDVAIRAARRAGVKLVIAAKVDAVDVGYFQRAVEPLLGDSRVEFIGEVDDAAKVALLRRARGLLLPILWPEPFGLALIEAMACGTPVITRRCGSTPEVVLDGKSGFICDEDDSLVRAIRNLDQIDRSTVRSWVEERFSSVRMAGEYESVFAQVLSPSRACA